MNARTPIFAALLPLCGLAACLESERAIQEDVDFAEASFVLEEPTDCEAAFDGPFLSELAEKKGWTDEDIASFCAELADIADVYADANTLTTVAMAGVGQLDGDAFESAYYVGAAGYDLSEIREWTEKAYSAVAVRRCVRAARQELRENESLPDGFVTECIEDETGLPYPEPIFRETRSNLGIDDIGDQGAGGAIALAMYNVPGEGTVVAFLGGAFYAQANPLYGAFLGCGAAIGFDQQEEDVVGSGLCMVAEYL